MSRPKVIKVEPYQSSWQALWDGFTHRAVNCHFFFQRPYMDYHRDRFTDHSLLFFDRGDLVALLPANLRDGMLISHGGLTFGGFLIEETMTLATMMGLFDALVAYMERSGLRHLVYKCIPYIYHAFPAQGDLYALFRLGARLYRRDVSSAISSRDRLAFQQLRRRWIKKARKSGLRVEASHDFAAFWQVLTENLARRHHTSPVHSLEEIVRLHDLFPENIRLFVCRLDNVVLGGALVYESARVAHTQYIATGQRGRELGALDLVFQYLIMEHYADKPYFDFGISTEHDGTYLNEGLVFHKESFGARPVVHDFYILEIGTSE